MSGISGDFDDKPHRSRRSSKETYELARLHEQLEGGELDEHTADLRSDDQKPYDDAGLIRDGLRLSATYDYTDANGHLLYQVLRYEHPTIPGFKKFMRRRPGSAAGNWITGGSLFKVPYRWHDLANRPDEQVFYVEGEKNADRLHKAGLLATTVASQSWSKEAVFALRGRHIVILPDNDTKGRENATKAADNLRGFAASLRELELPDLLRTGDVSDWLDAGHTVDELKAAAALARLTGIQATPAGWINSTKLPRRSWLYKPHYIRQFVSALIANGGIGKSSLALVEVLSMISGKPLLGIKPEKLLRAWYWNGEDGRDELERRAAAVMKHYELTPEDVGDRFFMDSGRERPIVIAKMNGRVAQVNDAVVEEVIATIRSNKIDVLVIDPFVNAHRVSENSNDDIDLVVKAFAKIAEVTNCSVMLVHHTRKANGTETTVEDARGASALHAAVRNARAVNNMSKAESTTIQISEPDRRLYFRADTGKANLTRPAEGADWYKLVSVDLENVEGVDWHTSDHVGVATPWRYPTPKPMNITSADIRRAQDIIKTDGPFRFDRRATKEPWVGIAIARALNIDLSLGLEKKRIAGLVNAWRDAGWMRVIERRHKKTGKDYPYAEVGNSPVDVTGVATRDQND